MNFVVQLGFAAAVAGIGWIAKKRVTAPFPDWEERIAFYDYIESQTQPIEHILESDNGKIKELNIYYKDASGSVNMAFAQAIPQDHLVLVLKTDKNESWSLEKNDKAIYVQRMSKGNQIMRMLDGASRDSSLAKNFQKESKYLSNWGINYWKPYDIEKKEVSINDVFIYIIKKEVQISFSYLENCQAFVKRVLKFMFDGIESKGTIYNYINGSSLSWNEEFKNVYKDVFVSEVKWLYKKLYKTSSQSDAEITNEFIGFLIKTSDGQYWSFEQDFNRTFIQYSNREITLMKYLNGVNRNMILKRGNDGFEKSYISGTRATKILDVLQIFNNKRKIYNNRQEFVEEALSYVYDQWGQMSTWLTCFDYTENRFTNIVDTALRTVDKDLVTKVCLYNKLVTDNRNPEDATVGDCIVMCVETNEKCYWSFEVNKHINRVQKSKSKENIVEKLNSVKRMNPLELINSFEDEKKRITIRGLLEFVIEFNRIFKGYHKRNVVIHTLQYFGYVEG